MATARKRFIERTPAEAFREVIRNIDITSPGRFHPKLKVLNPVVFVRSPSLIGGVTIPVERRLYRLQRLLAMSLSTKHRRRKVTSRQKLYSEFLVWTSETPEDFVTMAEEQLLNDVANRLRVLSIQSTNAANSG